jgi:CBS domain-containing protein
MAASKISGIAASRSELRLLHRTAGEVMTLNPISLQAQASVQEAIVLMTERGFSAAPVIDQAGRPIGVLSKTDLLIHQREYPGHASLDSDAESSRRSRRHGALTEVEVVDPTRVCDIMTPAVFTVPLHAPLHEVVRHMLDLKVHRLFVVDEEQSLVGVITALDVLRHLEPLATGS